MYKCTTAAGTLVYSDRPCAASKGGDPADAVVGQETLRLPGAAAAATGLPSAASIAQGCAAPTGTPITLDAAQGTLPERQRSAFEDLLRSLALSGFKRADLAASTLHLDHRHTLSWCMPKAQALRAYWIESNGRVVVLTPSGRVKAYNDANDPITLAGRCSDLVTTCFEPGQPGHSLDQCFAAAPACPSGPLDPAASCCPQACKDDYRRARVAGVDPLTASTQVLYGKGDLGSTCTAGRAGG